MAKAKKMEMVTKVRLAMLGLIVVLGVTVFVLMQSGASPLFSSADFTCQKRVSSFQIIEPNGGEKLVAGTQSDISWYQNCGGVETIEVSLRKGPGYGSQYYVIANSVQTVPGKNSLQWSIPEGFSGEDFTIRVGYKSSSIQYDVSNQPFTIDSNDTTMNPPDITVTSPNGGEVFHAGDTVLIKWNQSAKTGDPINARIAMEYAYPTGGYTTAYTVTSSTPSYVGENEYSWVVPSNVHAASIYMATVVLDRQWPENHMYLDRSDQRFTMTRP